MSGSHLQLEEARIYTEWIGEPQPGKPALVFLHDGLGCTRTLRRFPEKVANRLGLPAFLYDRWGYGQSDRRDSFPLYFMEDEAQRLPRILDAAGIEDCCLVAHSDGGTIALLHAATNEPRVRATVTIAAHVLLDELSLTLLKLHQDMVDSGQVPDFMYRFHGERGPHVLECWTSLYRERAYREWNICPAIRSIEGPLLAFQGDEDNSALPSQIDAIQAAVPHAEAFLLPGVGHFPHIEAPDASADVVAEFLAPYRES